MKLRTKSKIPCFNSQSPPSFFVICNQFYLEMILCLIFTGTFFKVVMLYREIRNKKIKSSRRNSLIWFCLCVAITTSFPLQAQLQRQFTIRHQESEKGKIVMLGNALLTNSVNGDATGSNNEFMTKVDADSDPTTTVSSGAILQLSSTASVLWAGLYWSGEDSKTQQTIRLKSPKMNSYLVVNSQIVDSYKGTFSPSIYSAFADVTQIVQQGGVGMYWAADASFTNSGGSTDLVVLGYFCGWSLVVMYSSQTEPCRHLYVYDGFAHVDGNANNVSININGFITPSIGTVKLELGAVVYEGDGGIPGDQFFFNNNALSDNVHPSNNFWNGTISTLGFLQSGSKPNYRNQLGIDACIVDASNYIGNNITSATVRFTSNGDVYFTSVMTMAVNSLYTVQMEATKSTCKGGSVLLSAPAGVTNCSWSPTQTLNGALTTKPIAKPTATTTYTMQGIDKNGCQVVGKITVNVTQPQKATLALSQPDFSVSVGKDTLLTIFLKRSTTAQMIDISGNQLHLEVRFNKFIFDAVSVSGGTMATRFETDDELVDIFTTLGNTDSALASLKLKALLNLWHTSTSITIRVVTNSNLCLDIAPITATIGIKDFCFAYGLREVQFISMTIAPNPVENETEISVQSAEDGNHSLQMFDSYGRLVFEKKWSQDSESQKNFVLSQNFSTLGSGIYYMIARSPAQITTQKLFIAK